MFVAAISSPGMTATREHGDTRVALRGSAHERLHGNERVAKCVHNVPPLLPKARKRRFGVFVVDFSAKNFCPAFTHEQIGGSQLRGRDFARAPQGQGRHPPGARWGALWPDGEQQAGVHLVGGPRP